MAYIFGTTSRLIFENGLDANPPQAAHVYAAVSVAQHDAFVGCYDAKYTYWSMRPFQVDPAFTPLFPTPNHPSYPSAHSCQSAAVATVLAAFFPTDAEAVMRGAYEAGDSRMWAGIHFQSDIDAGLALGMAVGEKTVEKCEEMVMANP